MPNSFPRISIVSSSYNQGHFLEETILSVLNQDYPNLEFIIIDGGSTDNSVDIIRKYERDLAYWVSEEDSGPEEALDKGFARATGDIFGLLNSDDLLMRGALHVVARTFVETGVDLVYGDGLHIDGEGRIISFRVLPDMHPHALLLYACGCLHGTGTYWTSRLHWQVGRQLSSLCPPGGAFDIAWFLRLTGVPGLKYKYLRVPLTLVRAYAGQRHTRLPKSMIGRERADYIREQRIPRWKLVLGGIFYGARQRFHYTCMHRTGLGYLLHIPSGDRLRRIANLGHEWGR